MLHMLQYRRVPKFYPIVSLEFSCCDLSVREKDLRSRAWSEGHVSAEHYLQCEAGELAGVTRTRQARPLSACTTHRAVG